LTTIAKYQSEMERIAAAHEWAREQVANLPPETVEQFGEANIISDLVHEFLMVAPMSQELIDLQSSDLYDEEDGS
jgi:hypothetical protein